MTMKTYPGSLFLYEEILLLALRDREGTVPLGTMYEYAIGGALLAELLLSGRIRLDSSRRKFVQLISAESLDDTLLDECLQSIAQVTRRRTLQTWVAKFASTGQLKHRIADQLIQHGILRAGQDKVFGMFNRRIYPEVDPLPEKRSIDRVREAVFSDSISVEPRTVALVSLAYNSGLLKLVLRKEELKLRKARIERIITGELTGRAVKDAIKSVQAATTIAAIIPAITSV